MRCPSPDIGWQANARTEMLMERIHLDLGFKRRAELLWTYIQITSARNEELTDFGLYAKGLMDRWPTSIQMRYQANNFFQYELGLLSDENNGLSLKSDHYT